MAAAAVVLLAGTAQAAFVFEGSGDTTQAPFYQTQVYSGFHNPGGGPSSFAIDSGYFYSSNTGPRGLTVDNSIASNQGATRYANSYSVASGFMAARNKASLTVTNAQAADGYYAVAGYGSRTTVQFFDADAAVSAVYRWNVTGVGTTPFGVATSRLDFRAHQGAGGDWIELFTTYLDPNYDPGIYTFNLAGDFTQPFDLMYWSSAYVQVNVGQATQGANFTSTADFASTYVLEGIDLFDVDGNRLDGWTLDENGTTVFNSTGRVGVIDPAPLVPPNDPRNDVPEPPMLALLAVGLAGLRLSQRRR